MWRRSVARLRCAERSGLLYLLRFNVVAVGGGGEFVVSFCEEKRRELCESTEMVCNYFEEPEVDGVEGQNVALRLWSGIEDLIALTI